MNSDNADHHLTCEVYFIPKELGGRHSACFNNYRGQFFYHYNDVGGSDWIARYTFDHEPVEAGETVSAKIELGGAVLDLAKERGMPAGKQFAIREGSKIVAVGIIQESLFNYQNRA